MRQYTIMFKNNNFVKEVTFNNRIYGVFKREPISLLERVSNMNERKQTFNNYNNIFIGSLKDNEVNRYPLNNQ